MQGRDSLVVLAQDAARIGKQQRTSFRQHQLAPRPLVQFLTDMLFKQADLLEHGRWRQVQFLARFAEVRKLADPYQRLEMRQLQEGIISTHSEKLNAPF